MLKFNCPHCHAALKVPDSKVGIEQPCPSCREIVKAPIPFGMESLDDFLQSCQQEHQQFLGQPREVEVVPVEPVEETISTESKLLKGLREFGWWVSIIVVALVIHTAIMQVYIKFTIKRELNDAAQDVQDQLNSIFQ